jgi:hypothetical protein
MFCNRQSAYLWVQTVLLFSLIYSFIRMRQTSYKGFSRKTKRSRSGFFFTNKICPFLPQCICIYVGHSFLYTRGGMNQMWILKNSKYLLEYIQSRPSPPAIALKHLTSLPSTQLLLTLSCNITVSKDTCVI